MVKRHSGRIGCAITKCRKRSKDDHQKEMTGQDSRDEKGTKFVSGVVEGFYGRPWSADQRRLLFSWMQKMGLNTYMYAPKDDYKHRAYWRELYSVEEAENLTNLISAASEKGITFIYAISPGLDISFSNTKDSQTLKRKLEQVATFGCDAFAVLFDDIDPGLNEADRSAFQSYASAQVSLSNELYQHLNQPQIFLFCPTEYCASRAIPNVASSEYLNTIGSKLLPGIDIMWTGPKVVSKKLTVSALEEIASVLKRPPVIWDNIHADDYDPRRIFLGPYDGRSPEIIPYIHGVLTNPNCEFEPNFIAIHTLGQWCRSNPNGVKKDIVSGDRLSPIAADIKLETESDCSDDDLPSRLDSRYQPKKALKLAISDWMVEIATKRDPPKRAFPSILPGVLPPGVPSGPPDVLPCPSPVPMTNLQEKLPSCAPGNPVVPPGVTPFPPAVLSGTENLPASAPPCLNPTELESPIIPPAELRFPPASPPAGMPRPDVIKTCLTPSSATNTVTQAGVVPVPMLSSGSHPPEPMPTFLQPPTIPVNSLVDSSASDSDSNQEQEPMEVATSGPENSDVGVSPGEPLGKDVEETTSCPNSSEPELKKSSSSDSLMQVEVSDPVDSASSSDTCPCLVTSDDISTLVDIFYMPFEYGSHAVFFLQRLHWLRSNAHMVKSGKKSNAYDASEWHRMAEEFHERAERVSSLMDKLEGGPNKSLAVDLYQYTFDIVGVLKICSAYVKWLALGLATHVNSQQTIGCSTWNTKEYRETFMSGDQEPWVFRGGLQSELQRLLPLDSAHDLFYFKVPDMQVKLTFTIRPYQPRDEDAVYNICLKTCDDGMDGTDVFPENPRLIGDKLVGKFVSLSPEFCVVVEDSLGVFGYAVAALDSRQLARKAKMAWTATMCQKYPKPKKAEATPVDEVIASFHGEQSVIPDQMGKLYPSIVRVDVLPERMYDPGIHRRLLAASMCALKSAGSKGVHCELSVGDKLMMDYYMKLHFFPLGPPDTQDDDTIYLGRPI